MKTNKAKNYSLKFLNFLILTGNFVYTIYKIYFLVKNFYWSVQRVYVIISISDLKIDHLIYCYNAYFATK